MVLSARSAGGSVRPILGSSFAPAQYGGAPEPPLEANEEVVSRAQPTAPGARRRDSPRVIETPRPEPDLDPRDRIASLRQHEAATFKPLVPTTPREGTRPVAASPEPPREAIREIAVETERPEDGEVLQPVRQLPYERPEQTPVFAQLPAQPEVEAPEPENPPRVQADIPNHELRPVATRAERRATGDLSSRSAKSTPQGDEIHISIGRIEITAAPSAAVRPAPKPTHKTPDLAEYLKRGNSR